MTLEEKMIKCEKERTFDVHVQEPDYSIVQEVDENFPYIKKGFWMKFRILIHNIFIIHPLSFYLSKIKYRTRVFGKKNLKGIKNAVITCNHIDMFDCLIVKRALGCRKLKIVAASFNNQKGHFGEWMRSGGMLPLSDNIGGMKKFNEAVKYYLEKGEFVLIYPETAMWHHYTKPRPHKVGAYHYAIKYQKPIIPFFITFRKNDRMDLHIMEPIYPNASLKKQEASLELMEKTMLKYKEKYEEVYQKKLEYLD